MRTQRVVIKFASLVGLFGTKLPELCLLGHVYACSAPKLSQLYLSQYLIPVYQRSSFATVKAIDCMQAYAQKVTATQKQHLKQPETHTKQFTVLPFSVCQ